jgi:polyisoprenoid-binding protein YceI
MATRKFNGIDIPTPGTYELDPNHLRVGFHARHMMVAKVRGSFNEASGAIVVAEDPADSTVSATIQTGSLSSGVEQRDVHLRSGDFLDAEKYPTIEFRTTGLKVHSGDKFTLNGELTIKDVTRPVELDVEFEGISQSPYGQEVIGFSATTEIDRDDFGITWNMAVEGGGVLVGKKVKIEIEGEGIRKEA